MASKTSISNLALSHLGVGKRIGNIETEQSQEADACRAFYDMLLEACLRDGKWGFAKRFAALNLIEENPTSEWGYSYRYPTDCVDIRRIIPASGSGHIFGEAFQASQVVNPRVPYVIGSDSGGRLIYTNTSEAEIEYTAKITDPTLYPPDFQLALSLLQAKYIAPRLTAGDPFKLGDRAGQLYEIEISKAKAHSYNEEQPAPTPESEFVTTRNG